MGQTVSFVVCSEEAVLTNYQKPGIALPMIFCQWAYLRSVRTFPASLAAISTLGVPVIGTYSSALILDEPVGFQEFGALVLVCMALATVLVIPALKRRSNS